MKIKKLDPKIYQQNNSRVEPKLAQKNHSKQEVPKEILEVAKGMETQFAHKLFAEMRKSIPKSKPQSSAESFYNSMLDYERAQIATETDSIGLKDVVLDQIYPQHKKKALTNTNQQVKMFYGNSRNKEIVNE